MPRVLFILLSLLVLVGCQKPMVLPSIFEAGVIEPFDGSTDTDHPNRIDLFYATDRKAATNKDPSIRYTRERSNQLTVGRARLQFGDDNDWPRIIAATQNLPNAKRFVPDLLGIRPIGPLQTRQTKLGRPAPGLAPATPAAADFIAALNDSLSQSPGKAITLYFHGYNNSFKESAQVAAEYDLYTGGLGPFILYSWPSYDSLLEYSHDRDSVRFTSSNARRLIAFLAERINAGKLNADQIHLVAHSSGAEIVGTVLRELALQSGQLTPNERLEHWRIGSVILIAPDISVDVARTRLIQEDIAGMFDELVIYGSTSDRPLQWASAVLYRTSRVGSIGEADLTEDDRQMLRSNAKICFVTVDRHATQGLINHVHHRNAPAVASDIILALRTRLSPAERGLARDDDDLFWSFPKDHNQRATDAAKRAYAPNDSP